MATDAASRRQLQAIRAEVEEVLARRQRALRARARALAQARPTPELAMVPEAVAAAPVLTRGWLIAEGDSWFDYPGSDILDWLFQLGYSIESVARAADRAETMAFGRGQLDKLAIAVEKVIAAQHKPKAILLSAGGNDIAGTEFGFLINHAGSPREGLNDSVITGVIDERVQDAYVHIIRKVTELCQRMLGEPVRIILHGYGYVIPDGDGVLGGFGPLPGPWLRPGFVEKGFNDLQANTATMKKLMDRFNAMLQRVEGMFGHVKYVDLRTVLPAQKRLWANELHPKPAGFRLAAEAISGAI